MFFYSPRSLRSSEQVCQADGKAEKNRVDKLLFKLKTCTASRDVNRGKLLHLTALEQGVESNLYIGNALINMYGRCGCYTEAQKVFDRMANRDISSWNSLIMGYVGNGKGEIALDVFSQMHNIGTCEPDALTFEAALKACTNIAVKEEARSLDGKLVKVTSLETGMVIHSRVANTLHSLHVFVLNSLVDMYSKCGAVVDARNAFDRLPSPRSVASWTALIRAHLETGNEQQALVTFSCMRAEGCVPSFRTYATALKACSSLAAKEHCSSVNGEPVKLKALQTCMAIHSQAKVDGCDRHNFVAASLIDVYTNAGSMADASRAFENAAEPDLVLWNVTMLGYVENGSPEMALKLFMEMQTRGFKPNDRSYLAAVKACSSSAEEEVGRQVDGKLIKSATLERTMALHQQARNHGYDSDVFVASSLIDTYCKCGSVVDASRVFDALAWRGNLVSWNSMIQGCGENGEGELGLELFEELITEGRIPPDSRTYAAVLKCCSERLALDAARAVHGCVCREGLESDTVLATCLTDVYGKCGRLECAQLIFDSSSTNVVETWTALMAAYCHQGVTREVVELFCRMEEEGVKPNGITFVCVLSACSHSGLVDKGKEYLKRMSVEFGVAPGVEHYHCMVDMLGRANEVEAAVELVKGMPWKPNGVTWMILLDACRKLGRDAFESLILH